MTSGNLYGTADRGKETYYRVWRTLLHDQKAIVGARVGWAGDDPTKASRGGDGPCNLCNPETGEPRPAYSEFAERAPSHKITG